MDDLNRRMQDAQRARARARQAELEQRYARGESVREAGRPLTLAAGEAGPGWVLGEASLQDGDGLEVFLQGAGWVPGRFRWDGRPDSAPVLRVALAHPQDATLPTGEAELALPEGAVCRPRG